MKPITSVSIPFCKVSAKSPVKVKITEVPHPITASARLQGVRGRDFVGVSTAFSDTTKPTATKNSYKINPPFTVSQFTVFSVNDEYR